MSTQATQLTLEGFANFSAGDAGRFAAARGDDARFDGGVRALGRLRFDEWPDIGLRLAAEVNEDDAELVEASVLVFGGTGRLEIGERPGLPDALTGYAPNNFQFTSAEFGPASGPSLDPSGRLQTLFLPAALAREIDSLASLGVTAALFDDRSAKILYVSPKKGGWLAGFSYVDDADAEAVEVIHRERELPRMDARSVHSSRNHQQQARAAQFRMLETHPRLAFRWNMTCHAPEK